MTRTNSSSKTEDFLDKFAPQSAADVDPWKEVVDPSTGGVYWWNTKTNATTPVGSSKPVSLKQGMIQNTAFGFLFVFVLALVMRLFFGM